MVTQVMIEGFFGQTFLRIQTSVMIGRGVDKSQTNMLTAYGVTSRDWSPSFDICLARKVEPTQA